MWASHVCCPRVLPMWAPAATLGSEEQRWRAVLVMGGRPSFPPPPVLGRSTLGAVDMPIGCALTFCVGTVFVFVDAEFVDAERDAPASAIQTAKSNSSAARCRKCAG